MMCAGFLTVGSLICALSHSLVPLIIGRGVTGLSLAAVPLGISLITVTLPAAPRVVRRRAGQRDARRRRGARPAAGRVRRRARRLPPAVLDPAWPAAVVSLLGSWLFLTEPAQRRVGPVRPPRRDPARRGPALPAAAAERGRRVGMGSTADDRAAGRRGRPACLLRADRAQGSLAAGRHRGQRQAGAAADQCRLAVRRVRAVRQLHRHRRLRAGPAWPPVTASAHPSWSAACACCPAGSPSWPCRRSRR